ADPVSTSGLPRPVQHRTFDLVYAIDVLHRSPVPAQFVREIARCSRRWLLLKDHTYQSLQGWLTLCALDELGNRRFSIPSLYKYQREWEWLPLIEEQGFKCVNTMHPAP
ncbi:class I SAM-dependent methyltransferase, partial [Burkholderia thailandensis]|uniref:class I SAM-dependent methyltransferase n=1 Tax=Burkholderia thailandensis TaxID=57975 RepID=UPI00217E5190